MMKAYLEKINGEWLDDFVYISKQHLIDMGFEIVPFDGDFQIDKLEDATTEDICIGSVQVTEKFFEIIGVKIPEYIGYPESLKPYYDRNIVKSTIGELSDFPFFIKPASGVKLFTGEVITNKKSIDFLFTYCGDDINKDTEVYVSEVINIESEFRCFVFDDELKGIQYYQGDFTKFPNVGTIKQMVKDYKDSPIAYTLDVGVTDSNKTICVEINDMWSIGSYGFNSKIYTLMCVRRMRELQGKLKK